MIVINGNQLSSTATVTANGTDISKIYVCSLSVGTCTLVWEKQSNEGLSPVGPSPVP